MENIVTLLQISQNIIIQLFLPLGAEQISYPNTSPIKISIPTFLPLLKKP